MRFPLNPAKATQTIGVARILVLLLTWAALASAAPVPALKPEALLKEARQARRDGKLEEAEQRLKECQQRHGDSEPLKFEWLLLRAQQGEKAARQELYSLLEKQGPDAGLILESLARGYLADYQPHAAAQALQRWLEREPGSAVALGLRGWLLESRGDTKGAEADYRRPLELQPDNGPVRLRLAEVLLAQLKPKEALPHFERLHRARQDARVVVGLARCRADLGEGDVAVKLLDDLLAREPKQAEALRERGKLALESGEAGKAETWLRRAEAVAPHDYPTAYQLARCLALAGKETEAKAQQARRLTLQTDVQRLADLLEGLERAPDEPGPRSEAGALCLRLGQEQQGLHLLRSALRADPRHAATHRTLADYYERAGKKELAERHRGLVEGK
jgi:Tfp pilus assembly protein PilF